MPYTFPAQWQAVPNTPAQVVGVVFAPSAPQIGYACNYPHTGGGNAPPGFTTTSDGGQTWHTKSAVPFASAPPFAGCTLFVDQLDAADVFLEQYVPIPNSEGLSTPTVWRSRDGGATWHQITTLKNTSGQLIPWSNIAVVGPRLIATTGRVGPNDGAPPNDLYASDDGGATWQQIAQSIVGQQLYVGPMTVVGATVVVEARSQCGCNGYSQLLPSFPHRAGIADHTRLVTPASSFQTNSHWLSADGGATWTKMDLPSGQVSEMSFTQSASGTIYGVALIYGLDPSNLTLHSALYSADGGRTWKVLPSFSGAGGGYPDPTTFGVRGSVAVAPNGTVVVGAWHDVNASIDAGIFTLRPGDNTPAWQPLAPGAATLGWQMEATATGARLWAVVPSADQSSFSLEYVDTP